MSAASSFQTSNSAAHWAQKDLEGPEGNLAAEPVGPTGPTGLTDASGKIRVGRRRSPRLRLSLPAKLISLYARHRCILIDLSCSGAQLGLEQPLAPKETAFLLIGGKELFCDIVRADEGPNGGINGVVFDPPLKSQTVLDMRAYAETYQRDQLRGLRAEVRDWVEGAV